MKPTTDVFTVDCGAEPEFLAVYGLERKITVRFCAPLPKGNAPLPDFWEDILTIKWDGGSLQVPLRAYVI